MIEDIIKLRRRGLSFRKIARELDTTVGKVQYQWTKLLQNKAKRSSEEPVKNKLRVECTCEKDDHIEEDTITLTRIADEIVKVEWKVSAYKENMVAHYFKKPIVSWKKALRIYDVTGVIFNGENAQSDHEIVLSEHHTEWIFKGLKPEKVYCIELGFKFSEDCFFPLLRSKALHASNGEYNHLIQPKENIHNAAKWSENVSTYTYYETVKERN